MHAWTSGDAAARASGNGSIMRLAPVPITYAPLLFDGLDILVERAVESSRPTHASPQCLSACAYFGVLLAGLLHGLPREEVLDPDWPTLRRLHEIYPLHSEIAESPKAAFGADSSGHSRLRYVVKSLEAALWAFHGAADFREAVLRAVNLGDDADTTGAMCGQLAGAHWGEPSIPSAWRDGLAGRELIEGALLALLS